MDTALGSRVGNAIRRRWRAAGALLAAGLGPDAGVTLEGDASRARVVLVSSAAPPETNGFSIILEELFSVLPGEEVLVVTPIPGHWDRRPRVTLRSRELLAFQKGPMSTLADVAVELEARRMPALIGRIAPHVELVFGLMDRCLPIAGSVAAALSLPLWLYCIDDHTRNAGPILSRGRRKALASTSRMFALSNELAAHVQSLYGAPAATALLPLCAVPEQPAPMHHGPTTLVFVGNIYGYHRDPFERLAGVAKETGIQLRVVTPKANWGFVPFEVPKPWQVVMGAHGSPREEIESAHVGVILLDPDPNPASGMSVAFPTKFRDYTCVGRPILALAPQGSATERTILSEGIGWSASTVDQLVERVRELGKIDRDELGRLGRRSHAFGTAHLDLAVARRLWASREPPRR